MIPLGERVEGSFRCGVESAVSEYELHVSWLSEREKDEMARASAKFLLLFGVPAHGLRQVDLARKPAAQAGAAVRRAAAHL